ncbi:unnamed protein product [Dracunculus medinensis]|uniref:Uncharacterized protein n=1 Tax=Dracunculus medinensis TaxID=318479 RepID=A0A0N4US70_DRAME|nr:unnamed protein product [Dracunculus medinensis]
MSEKSMSGIRTPYLRVLGIQTEMSGPGRAGKFTFTPEEQRIFRLEIFILNFFVLSITKSWYKYRITMKNIVLYGFSNFKVFIGLNTCFIVFFFFVL